MCGIFGIIDPQDSPRSLDAVLALGLNAILPRGPDDHGVVRERYHGFDINLVNTRLSIIDLSEHGQQPMRDHASDWCIIFNGEIYNYLEVREELHALGWKFHGHSDTEVLLKAWTQWGLRGLDRLNGMFAFAVFNSTSGELWLVRDRFGVKPLLWARLPGGGVVFSSSVAAVASLSGAEVDTAYCARGAYYKAFEVPGSEAPFKGVNAVSAGGWLKVQLKDHVLAITDGCWYNLGKTVAAKLAEVSTCSDKELEEQCVFLLENAVKLRLRSDVPVAVSLSGGLDSSSIAANASRHVDKLTGFTYGLPSEKSSEGARVRDFSAAVGIHAQYIWPPRDAGELSQMLERAFTFQEAPFCGLSVLAQNEVFRAVRASGFKVLLGGQGGDEIFAGYRKFFVVALREALHHKRTGVAFRLLYSLGIMLFYEASQARLYWQNLDRYRQKKAALQIVNWEPVRANLWGNVTYSLTDRQIEDVRCWSLPSLLRYEDRNSMGYGLETRLPFMDYRLVELALALPAGLKINKGYGKWALRAATAGLVPDFIRLNRKKRGFDVTQDWIHAGIGEALRSQILGNLDVLKPHLKNESGLKQLLSDTHLARNPHIRDEAMVLVWLTRPLRLPKGANPA